MLFLLSFIMIAIGCVLFVIGKICWDSEKNALYKFFIRNFVTIQSLGFAFVVTGAIAVSVLFVTKSCNNDLITELNDKYNVVMIELESDACKDELSLNNLNILQDVQSWNKTVTRYQKLKNGILTYNLYPDEINSFKTIEYEKYFK